MGGDTAVPLMGGLGCGVTLLSLIWGLGHGVTLLCPSWGAEMWGGTAVPYLGSWDEG